MQMGSLCFSKLSRYFYSSYISGMVKTRITNFIISIRSTPKAICRNDRTSGIFMPCASLVNSTWKSLMSEVRNMSSTEVKYNEMLC